MPKSVIFDLGGVLLDWDPRHLYRKLFDGDDAAMERFLGEICTMAWHLQHDAGRPFAETCAELKPKHPGHGALIEAFAERHDEMTAGAIPGTVALLQRLAAGGVPLYAITNYPAQTFPIAQQKFPFLALFRDVAVSGVERVLKPSCGAVQHPAAAQQPRGRQSIFIDELAQERRSRAHARAARDPFPLGR